MTASDTLFDSRGGFSGSSYPMNTADFEVQRDVSMASTLAFYIWGAHWHHLKNTTEPSMCGGDAALCQITLTTCYYIAYNSNGVLMNKKVYTANNFNSQSKQICSANMKVRRGSLVQ